MRLTVPGRDQQQRLNRELVVRSWLWGYITAREELDLELRRRRARYMGTEPPGLDWSGPPPAHAMEWAFSRQVLLGKWDRQLDDSVSAILVHALETGATRKEMSRALAEIFPEFARDRLENIARTETTSALAQGRLAKFREPGSRVAGVQFVAILDARTTRICRDRDGLIMLLDDPRLPANTPPLHYQCRSTLVPLSHWDLEDLRAGDPDVEEQFFGYLPEGAPKSLEEALKGWKRAEKPLPGFGEVGKKPKEKKKPRQLTPAESPVGPDADGGIGYSDKPRRFQLGTTDLALSEDVAVTIRNHWKFTGELESVQATLSLVNPESLRGLTAVEFVNHRITTGRSKRALATYSPEEEKITLTRDEPRDWRSSANRKNRRLAASTLLHELAHHFWFRDQSGDLRRQWALALKADGVTIPGAMREETFAEEFVKWIWRRRRYGIMSPEVAKFYEQFIR